MHSLTCMFGIQTRFCDRHIYGALRCRHSDGYLRYTNVSLWQPPLERALDSSTPSGRRTLAHQIIINYGVSGLGTPPKRQGGSHPINLWRWAWQSTTIRRHSRMQTNSMRRYDHHIPRGIAKFSYTTSFHFTPTPYWETSFSGTCSSSATAPTSESSLPSPS